MCKASIHFVSVLGGVSSGANLVVSLYSDLAGVPGASLVALGPGFLGTRAVSANSGGSWITFSNQDMGMLVLAESADAVPELDTRTIIQPFFMVTLLLGGAISVRRG